LHESITIRRELFKLKYVSHEFVLHDKADAFEAFDFILTAIHTWEKRNGPPHACEFNEKQQLCLVHHFFGLKRSETPFCTGCRAQGAPKQLDANMFAETLLAPVFLEKLVTFASEFSIEYSIQG
jgi:hypothetical protein